jgi:tetratricopeptide (TPR) repeat protein
MSRVVSRVAAGVLVAVLCGCAGTPQARRDKFLSRGKQWLEKKEYSRALLEFRNAAGAMPNDAEVFYQIGLASWGSKDYGGAFTAFQKALSINPKHSAAELKLVQLQIASHDPEMLRDSANRLKSMLEQRSPTVEMLNALALTELSLDEPEGAVGPLEQVLAQSPQALESAVLLANAKTLLKDVKGAQAVIEKAVNDSPKSAAARTLLGNFFASQNKAAEAEAAFTQATALDPGYGPPLRYLGVLQMTQGRMQEADANFKKLSKLDGYKSTHAIFLYRTGHQPEAAHEFEQLVRDNPDDRQMRTNLVIAYRTTNQLQEADKLLEKALKKNRKDMVALLQRAEISIGKGKYADAEIDLNQLLNFRPDSAEGHYIMARLNLARGTPLQYREEMFQALKYSPDLLKVRLELAQYLTSNGQAPAALEQLDGAPAFQKTSAALLIQRNWALWTIGNMAEMRKGIDRGLAVARTPDFLIQDGFWKLRNGNPAGARTALEEALKIDPTDLRALQGIRQSYLAQKNAPMALQKAKEFAAQHPSAAPVQQFLGNILAAAGMKTEARVAFETARAAAPKDVSSELSLIQLDMSEGKLDQARKRLENLMANDRNNKTARFWLADVSALLGQNDPAIAHFREVVSVDSNNAEAFNNLAYLLIEKEPDEALKFAKRAVELVPTRPAYADTLGWALYRKGMYTAAVPYLERATAEKVVDPVWTYHLAMAYAKSGDAAKGRRSLEAALKQNPNVPEAKLAKEIIGQ